MDTEIGRWTDRGDTVIYESSWVRLVTTDVVMPDGTQVDHHVVRMPRSAAVDALCRFFPADGLLDQEFHIFIAHDAAVLTTDVRVNFSRT